MKKVHINKSLLAPILFFVLTCFWLYYQLSDFLVIVIAFFAFYVLFIMAKGKSLLGSNSLNKRIVIGIIVLALYVFCISVVHFFAGENADNFKSLINSMIIFLLIMSCFFAGYNSSLLRTDQQILKAISILALINSLVNLYSWFIFTGGVVGRYNFSSIITHSVSANIGLSIIGALLFLSRAIDGKKINYLFFLICASNAIIIVTRQKQILFIVYLLLFVLICNKKEKNLNKAIGRIVVLLFACLAAFFIFKDAILTSLSTYKFLFDAEGRDSIERSLAAKDSIEMFNNTLGFGVGLGGFSSYSKYTVLASPHNGFYSILSEVGIVGILYIVLLILLVAVIFFRTIKQKNQKTIYAIAIILLLEVVTLFVSNCTFLPPVNERTYYLDCAIIWIFLGILIGIIDSRKVAKYDQISN